MERGLSRPIGKELEKPCWFPIPALVLRIVFGKMADEMLLCSQGVIPKRLLEAGFKFTYPRVTEAFENLLGKGKK